MYYQSSCGCYCDNTTGRCAWERSVGYASSHQVILNYPARHKKSTSLVECCIRTVYGSRTISTLLVVSVISIDSGKVNAPPSRGCGFKTRQGLTNYSGPKHLALSYHRSLWFFFVVFSGEVLDSNKATLILKQPTIFTSHDENAVGVSKGIHIILMFIIKKGGCTTNTYSINLWVKIYIKLSWGPLVRSIRRMLRNSLTHSHSRVRSTCTLVIQYDILAWVKDSDILHIFKSKRHY